MLKNVRKNIVIASIIFLLIFAVLFLLLGIESNNNATPLYSYTANKKGDYQVLLKENNFYEKQILESDKYYAAKSIDKYLLKFEYDFEAKKIENINYKYNITAELLGTVSNNNEQGKEIWTKKYILLEDKEAEINQDTFSIIENVEINYDIYNNMAREYEDNYDISIDAVLKVIFNISYDMKFENGIIEKAEDYVELDVALTNDVSHIEKNYEDLSKKEILPTNKNKASIYYVISGVCIFLTIVLILNKKEKNPEEEYKRKIKYILKNYNELIVTVSNEPNLDNYSVMNINTLEALINLAEQNEINIIHYESIKDKKNKFYVFVNKFVYIYQV